MAYITKADLIASIADVRLAQALDDNRDGQEDNGLWAAISAEVDNFIGGYLDQAGISTIDPVPGRLKFAALRYAEYRLLFRSKLPDRAKEVYDQWIKPAMAWLERIATREESLAMESQGSVSGAVISEPSRIYSESGRLMV